ncbi:HNH endonuclease signature motif containing protein [Sinomonas sp. G460-2]|uniref:HNH endonuclease signature motif containing protein n=1 Tax=Sinomonas sp. G460-2 TaxID=3393464 RepID=UPI0039F02E4D
MGEDMGEDPRDDAAKQAAEAPHEPLGMPGASRQSADSQGARNQGAGNQSTGNQSADCQGADKGPAEDDPPADGPLGDGPPADGPVAEIPVGQEVGGDPASQSAVTDEPAVEGPAADSPARLPMLPSGAVFEADAAFVDGLVETVKMLEAHEARIHALRSFALSELCEHFRRGARDRLEAAEAPTLAAAEIAAALNVSQRTGRAMVEEARALAEPGLAPVLDALRDGRLDRRRARAVVEHAAVLPPGKDAAFAAAAVELGCPQGDPALAPSPGAFSRRLRRLAEEHHPEALAARKAHATAFRRVDVEPTRDGMCWITAHLPLEVGAAIDTRLEAIARSLQTPGEDRGISQLRADVFRDLLLASAVPSGPGLSNEVAGSRAGTSGTANAGSGRPDSTWSGEGPGTAWSGVAGPDSARSGADPGTPWSGGAGPDSAWSGAAEPAAAESVSGAPYDGTRVTGGVRMEVVVTVPARTLTGESEVPGEILGYGSLDAPAARLLAAQAATWTTMWVHPDTGAPLALGRRRYTPSLAIRRFLGARDRTCRFPGCDKPAQSTETDHTIPWQHGGTTDAANLALLCPEHHRLKSLGHWKVKQLDPEPWREEKSTRPEATEPGATGPWASGPWTAGPGTPASDAPHPHPSAQTALPPPGGVLEWTSPTGRKYVTHPETDAPPPF